MTAPSQPPPSGVSASPPGTWRKILSRILWLGLGCIAFVAAWMLWNFIAEIRTAPSQSKAIINVHQIGVALQAFDAEYGHYPDASTIAAVKEETNTELTLRDGSSNQLFRQLIVSGLKTEEPFYAKTAGSHPPDEQFFDDQHALTKGECSYAYVSGLGSSSSPAAPVVMAPLIRGTTTFDPGPFHGKAVILFTNGGEATYHIDSSGHVRDHSMDLFDPNQPFWHGKAPDIKWPE